MKNVGATLTVFAALTPIASIALGAPAKSQESCSSQISLLKHDIQDRLGAKIISIETNVNPSSPFGNAQNELRIRLGSITNNGITTSQSRAADNILKSPALTKSYSQKLISSCAGLAGVVFSVYEYNEGWALLPNGKLQKLKCADAGKASYAWGETPCL